MRLRAALLVLLAAPVVAQTSRVPPVRTIADLGACDTFKLVGVTDGTSGATCSSGGGTTDVLCLCADGTWTPIPTSSSSGTVSSVQIAVPSEWSVSGGPITTSGTITIAEATQTANTVYAGPTTGSAAAPGFRSLVSADIPNNAANTSGNAGTATALAANGANCSAGSYPLGVDASGAAESCTVVTADPTLAGDVDGLSSANDLDEVSVEAELEAVLDLQDLQGAVTDAQVPDGITVTLAATATALAANGANCSAGSYPLGVDASGAAESCTVAGSGTIGGTLGAADNTVPRSDGTGAATLQASALVIDDAGVARLPTLGSELPTYSFTTAQDANNVYAGITAFSGNLYTIVNNAGAALRTINITSTSTTGAVGEWTLSNTVASATSPVFQPNFGDGDTGIGRAGADQLSLIAGGVEAVRVTTTGATLKELQFTPTDTPTACADGTRGRVYFDDSLGEHCGCKGATGAATWQQLDGGGSC